VVARTFDDLQALGFAPAALAEDRVRKAIAEADLEALRAGCRRCSGPGPPTTPSSTTGSHHARASTTSDRHRTPIEANAENPLVRPRGVTLP
jgi:hypothetical protein